MLSLTLPILYVGEQRIENVFPGSILIRSTEWIDLRRRWVDFWLKGDDNIVLDILPL